MTTTTTVISRPNPYVGPRPYREGETIYGRERETSELLDILIAERIVLLYSPSGAGKSSLLNAAILPKMAEQNFQVYPTIRLNMEPPKNLSLNENFNRYVYSCIQSIEEGLPEEKRFPNEELVNLKFKTYLAKYAERDATLNPDKPHDAPILLVFDQAEEVIRILLTDRPKKMDFFIQLGEVLRDRNIWALIATREDYLASFDPYLRPIPTRLANRYRLTLLDTESAIKAVQLPAQSAGIEFPDECAQQVVDDLRAMLVQQPDGTTTPELGPTVEPVQLQVVCRRLWTNLPNDEKVVTLEHVKSLGDVNRALADYYALQAASVANMSKVPEREIREWFQRKLITASGIRGQVLLTPERSDGLNNEAIWMLERAYLIRAEKRGGATWFELAHDRLVSPIIENNNAWVEKHLNVVQRRADLWNIQGRPDSMLIVGAEFPAMETWIKANPQTITLVEKDFYRDSLKAYQSFRRERAANILIRWLFIASVISTIVAVGFFIRSHVAEEEAQARELAAASLGNLQIDPERSVLLDLEGLSVTTDPHPEIIQALHQSLPEMRIVRSSDVKDGHSLNVYTIAYSPDGNYLASASKDGTVKIWDSSTLKVLQTKVLVPDISKYGGYGLLAAAYSPDGKSLAAVGADGKLSVLDTSTWNLKYQVQADKGMLNALAYSPDGKYIATGGVDSVARIWDASTGKKLYNLGGENGNQQGIEALTFGRDSASLFTGGDNDKVIYAWDVKTGKYLYKFNAPGDRNTIYGLAVSPDGQQLASSGSDRLIRLWDIHTQNITMEIPGHVDWVYGLTYSVDGQSLISASADRTIRIWDVKYGRIQMVLDGPADQVFGVSVNPKGRYLASASADKLVRLWDISLQGSHELMTLDHKDKVHDVLFSPDGKQMASAGTNGVINIWDAATGAKVKKLLDTTFRSAEVMFWGHPGSQDTRYLAAGYQSGQTVVWDTMTDKPVLTIAGNGAPVLGLSLNGDNSLITTGDTNGIVHVYDTKSGKEITSLNADKELGWRSSGDFGDSDMWISATVFSPDGKYIAASYATYKVVIWDWKAGKIFTTLTGHNDIVEKVTFSPDGTLLASASDDSTIILWTLNPSEGGRGPIDPKNKITDPHFRAKLEGHRAVVYDAAFSPDEKTLVSSSADGLIKVWDLENDSFDMDLYGNTGRIHSVAFSPNGKRIVSGGSDNSVRVFTLDTNELIETARQRVTRQLTDVECREYLNASCETFRQSDPLKPITDFFNRLFHW